jgi:hypothetical protein
MSAADCAASLIQWRHQASKITFNSASGCDPCSALVDVTACRLRSEKVGSIVGYAVAGAISECPVDNSVPSSSAVRVGGSFSEGVGDPFGWLVGNGRESVLVSVLHFSASVHVFDDEFTSVSVACWRRSSGI